MIAGLVLAAGAGTRFGQEPKLLAELDGRPLLEHAVAAQCAVDAIDRVVVVLGSRAEEIRQRVAFGRAEVVVCEAWQDGQSASLRCGAAALAGAGAVIVTLGDMPRVGAELIARFAGEPPRTRATYHGRPGHPVVLGPAELAAVAELRGDVGARELLAGGRTIECSPMAGGDDVDTPQDLAVLREGTSEPRTGR
ncbi:MAG TPA: nucleotidyltransferase family protein [Solirubrobacteraceae bacterium]|nr:nucleotidyltransferase family protein [Solirubrobacteraceae bacterium]